MKHVWLRFISRYQRQLTLHSMYIFTTSRYFLSLSHLLASEKPKKTGRLHYPAVCILEFPCVIFSVCSLECIVSASQCNTRNIDLCTASAQQPFPLSPGGCSIDWGPNMQTCLGKETILRGGRCFSPTFKRCLRASYICLLSSHHTTSNQ